MCGLAGWFTPDPRDSGAGARLASMISTLAHRGPDGRGELCGPHFAFAHVRLAIIDPAGGAQPMTSADGSVSIVFNGEIYNYAALRAELARRGARFATHSDTEVILELYRIGGTAAFARLRGMFAFALWDRRRRTGYLVRDRNGIKPLFLAEGPAGALAFASEAKALIAWLERPVTLDEHALHLVMNFRYLPGDRTLFRNVRQLAPGTVLAWRPDGPPATEAVGAWPVETVPEPLAALEDSVRAHLTADVEVATYLSGGIDSAAVTALARRHAAGLRTFTVAVGDDPAEADNAARSAALLGVANVRGEASAAAADLPRIVHQLEVPKVNAWQSALLARHAARHVKVALSGLGGDELFYGYRLHRLMQLVAHAGRLPGAVRRAGAAATAAACRLPGVAQWTETERAALAVAAAGDWPRVYALLRNVWDDAQRRRRIYGPRLLDARLPDALEVLRSSWPADADPVRAAARYERREKMVNDLLWQEDRLSMAEGLEVRVPFVDPLVEAAVDRLPVRILMPGGRLKGWLRRALDGLLPAEILRRPKSGFQVDAVTFVRGPLAPLVARFLSDAAIRDYGLFNPAFVRATLGRRARRGLRWHHFILYLMLGAHLWVEIFERGADPAALAAGD